MIQTKKICKDTISFNLVLVCFVLYRVFNDFILFSYNIKISTSYAVLLTEYSHFISNLWRSELQLRDVMLSILSHKYLKHSCASWCNDIEKYYIHCYHFLYNRLQIIINVLRNFIASPIRSQNKAKQSLIIAIVFSYCKFLINSIAYGKY